EDQVEDFVAHVLLDEERRLASHREVKASINEDVNTRIKRESARSGPEESAEISGVAEDLKRKSVHEAADTERELGQGRTAARMSQFLDYAFYLIYGVIVLQFLLRLMAARAGNGFVQFISAISWPILAPFERIVATPSRGGSQIQLSYLFALIAYILLHLAINGMFRLVAHRKVTV
ncbi:MAG: YggT family protein, partial [Acidobacteriota bacterium]